MLIGVDLFYELLLPDRRTQICHPVLQETVLGWIISGRTPVLNNPPTNQRVFLFRENASLEQNLNRFWEAEPMEQAILTPEHQACEQHFITHTTQQQDGRFVVRLPLKEEPNQLGTSYRSEHRLIAIERRLECESNLKNQYHQFMKEYEELGHMQPVTTYEEGQPCYYSPHHPVFKETSSTTKTHVVLDVPVNHHASTRQESTENPVETVSRTAHSRVPTSHSVTNGTTVHSLFSHGSLCSSTRYK